MFILTTICDFFVEIFSVSLYMALVSSNKVYFEKAFICICICTLLMLSYETGWRFGIDAWVGQMYHTDTRLVVAFMNILPFGSCH
jgi:hypothetical protein